MIEAEGLRQNAPAVGLYLRDTLEAIAKDEPRISAVRACGLYAAADFADPATGEPDGATAIRVVNGPARPPRPDQRDRPGRQLLKIRPPLPFARPHVDRLAEALTDTLAHPLTTPHGAGSATQPAPDPPCPSAPQALPP